MRGHWLLGGAVAALIVLGAAGPAQAHDGLATALGKSRAGHVLEVVSPPNANVAPPGPYMLFVNRSGDDGLVPSKARQLLIR